MTTTRIETITATTETLDTTMQRILSQRGILQAMDATGDAYTLTVGWPVTEAPASERGQVLQLSPA